MQTTAAWRTSIERELLDGILPWWIPHMDSTGGWPGHITNEGTHLPSPRGIVMHARFLWSYSAAWRRYGNEEWARAARHAWHFIRDRLSDPVHGGCHWMIEEDGRPTVPQKVIYGQAFALYGMAEYYRASADPEALAAARRLFGLIEGHSRDRVHGGYFEAVSSDWSTVVINSLSDVDIPCAKSMNTNLHVMEAFTTLLLADPSEAVRAALKDLIMVHLKCIRTSPENFGLYFDADWKPVGAVKSYGHDIEGSWLIMEAAEAAWGHDIPSEVTEAVLTMARGTLAVIRAHGPGLVNESDGPHLDRSLVWWVQAECCVGLANAWQITGDPVWLEAAQGVWSTIMSRIKDPVHGEWFWGRKADGSLMDYPKGGLWKTSYHNGRACLELIRRLADA